MTYRFPFFLEYLWILEHFIHFVLVPLLLCCKLFDSVVVICIVSIRLRDHIPDLVFVPSFCCCCFLLRPTDRARDGCRRVPVKSLDDIDYLNLIQT